MGANGIHTIAVIGAGGHSKVVISTLRAAGHHAAAVYDDDSTRWGSSVLNVPIVGAIEEVRKAAFDGAVIAIGSNKVRRDIAEKYFDLTWVCALHPSAAVDPTATVAPGTVVFAGAVVQAEARLGRHVIVNTLASVDHDCDIGDFAQICPGAHLAGGVTAGSGSFFGTGCAVAPGIRLGDWSTAGAGAVVLHDVPHSRRAFGVPARLRD